jgi:hypothetical protein
MAMVSLEDGLGRHNQNVPMRPAENACLEWILAHGSSDVMRVRCAEKNSVNKNGPEAVPGRPNSGFHSAVNQAFR